MGKKKISTIRKTDRKSVFYIIAFVVLMVSIFGIYSLISKETEQGSKQLSTSTSNSAVKIVEGVKILKDGVTTEAKFFPYKSGDTYMEIIAVKAADGSIKTVLNTCQVCYSSGRGYYKQDGELLVCQNCGNAFRINDIGAQQAGCNPVPITDQYKAEDDGNVIVSKDFLDKNKGLFANWSKQ